MRIYHNIYLNAMCFGECLRGRVILMQKKTPSSLTVDQDHPGQRLDNFLFCHLSHIPKTRIYRAIRSGEVRVNKKRYKANTKLVPGDVVRVPPPFQYGATEKKVISQRKLKTESGRYNDTRLPAHGH